MKHDSTEQRIIAAFQAVTPDLKSALLSEVNEMKKGEIPTHPDRMPEKKKTPWASLGALAAALLLVLGLGYGAKLLLGRNPDPTACVMIDVNPSVALLLDQSDRVVSAEAKNDDGAQILAEMDDLTGADVKLAVNAVVGAMLRQGYLSDLANSVLITVDSADEGRSLRLRDSLSADARDYLQSSGLDCSILSQILEPGAAETAEENGISPGKALLVERLTAANPQYDASGLSALSIHELSLLLTRNAVSEVHASGQSSEKAYIGREAAEEIALAHAGVNRSEAAKLKSELEYEGGSLVYEVEFEAAGNEFEYDVDAVSGEIRKVETEPLETGHAPANSDDDDPDDINDDHDDDDDHDDLDDDHDDDDDADDDHDDHDVDDDHDDDYERDDDDADDHDGDDADDDDDHDGDDAASAAPGQQPVGPSLISANQALEIALHSVGTDRGSIRQLELELDREKGSPIYEVEFKLEGYEHDFEIDAVSGSSLQHTAEPDD